MAILSKMLIVLVFITIGLVGLLLWKHTLTKETGGKILAFVAFFILPALVVVAATNVHFENSKKTEFCLTCHNMEPYGESLYIDDQQYLPASHFQNNRVPKDKACFTCHTSYAQFGGIKRKIGAMRHAYVYYMRKTTDEIKLYEPYNNRECLHCHDGARSFVENVVHTDILPDLGGNVISCLDCHNLTHAVKELANLKKWQRGE